MRKLYLEVRPQAEKKIRENAVTPLEEFTSTPRRSKENTPFEVIPEPSIS